MTPSRILDHAMKNIKPLKPIVRTADDEFVDYLRSECAKAIADYLKKSLNTDRPIVSLSRHEMHGMAEAVTSRWTVLVSERIASLTAESERLSEADKERVSLLYGG